MSYDDFWVGLRHEGAKPKKNVPEQPSRERMKANIKGPRRNPSSDQKKVRRQLQRKASGKRIVYRGISLQGASKQFAWGLDEAIVRKFNRAMKSGDHQTAAKVVLDLCEESGEFVEGGKFGVWWSTDLNIARGYAGMHTRESLACVIHAEIDDDDIQIAGGDAGGLGYSYESPVILNQGARIDVVAIEVRYNPNLNSMADGEFVKIPVRRQVTAKTAGLSLEAVVSVAEQTMERSGNAGRTLHIPTGHADDPAYQAALAPFEDWVRKLTGRDYQRFYASDYQLNEAGGVQGMVTSMGSIVVRPVTNEMTVLHEVAHVINRTTEGHGHDEQFCRTARDLYAKHISPEAAKVFWDLVEPFLGRTATKMLSRTGAIGGLIVDQPWDGEREEGLLPRPGFKYPLYYFIAMSDDRTTYEWLTMVQGSMTEWARGSASSLDEARSQIEQTGVTRTGAVKPRKVKARDLEVGMRVVTVRSNGEVNHEVGTITNIHGQGISYTTVRATIVFDFDPSRPVQYPWDQIRVLPTEHTAARSRGASLRTIKTAGTKRTVYRGISLQGASRQFAWGLDEAIVRKFNRAMEQGDHQTAAKIVLDLCEQSGEFVEGGGFGVWWSTDLNVARGYAGMHTRDSLACVIHAEIDDDDIEAGGEARGYTYDSPVVLKPGAKVDVVAVEVRYNPDYWYQGGQFVKIPVMRQVTAKTAAVKQGVKQSAARGFSCSVERRDIASKTAAGWYHTYESDFRVANNLPPFGPATPKFELETLAQRILTDEKIPYGDEAYIWPADSSTTSMVGWQQDAGALIPVLFIGSSMMDPLTVVHECAHHVDLHRKGLAGRAATYADTDASHNADWAATFTRLARRYYPEAAEYLETAFSAHVGKTAFVAMSWTTGPDLDRCTEIVLAQFGIFGEKALNGLDVTSALMKHGWTYRPVQLNGEPFRGTVKQFYDTFKTGKYYFATSGHALAMIDGMLVDSAGRGPDGRKVIGAFHVYRPGEWPGNQVVAKTAARFEPAQMSSWESTRPWNLSPADAEAQVVPGWWHKSQRGTEAASWEKGYIRPTPDFYALPEQTRRAVAYHEAGHAMIEAAGGLSSLEDPLSIIELPGAQGLGHNAEEVLAEAYSAVWCDPDWFQRMGAHQILAIVVKMARRAGFPLPGSR